MEKGLVLVYTGDGKGKTTAALGLALRASGHGKRVFMLQFMKKGSEYGEIKAAASLPGITIVQKGVPGFIKKGNPRPEDLHEAEEAISLARQVIAGGEYDMVILDEINVALDFGLLGEEEVLNLLKLKPEHVTLVLTGRNAAESVMSRADMVSEVREIKHHYQKGVPSQRGIEY